MNKMADYLGANQNGNGRHQIVQIADEGMRTFQFGQAEPFEIDVIHVSNRWEDMQKEFLGPQDASGNRPVVNVAGWSAALMAFVTELNNGNPVSGAQAQKFLREITRIAGEIQDFFDLKSPAKSSSRANSDTPASDSTTGPRSFSGPASNSEAPGSYSTILEVMPGGG